MLTTAHTCSYSKVIGIRYTIYAESMRLGVVTCVNNRCNMHSAVAIMQLHCICIIHAQCACAFCTIEALHAWRICTPCKWLGEQILLSKIASGLGKEFLLSKNHLYDVEA